MIYLKKSDNRSSYKIKSIIMSQNNQNNSKIIKITMIIYYAIYIYINNRNETMRKIVFLVKCVKMQTIVMKLLIRKLK